MTKRLQDQRDASCAPAAVRCPVARECGACQHVHMPYAEQLARKDARVAELFDSVAARGAVRPIIGMDDPYHYRNKVVSPYAPGRKLSGRAGGSKAAKDARGARPGAGRDGGKRGGGRAP